MKPVFFQTPSELRAWFANNHAEKTELLVGFFKRSTKKPSITWDESVEEALCFGWIDGVRRSLGKEAYTIRFTPRKPTSIWSVVNVKRVKALIAKGRMMPAGLAAFEKRTPEKTGVYSFERTSELTPAQAKKLRGSAKAKTFFDAQPPWYRRAAVHWVTSAKKEETKERRLAQLIEDSASGRTIPPLTRSST